MAKTYIKCAKCGDYAPYADSFDVHIERNLGSFDRPRSKFSVYICESCAYKYMVELGEETNNEDNFKKETKDEL